MKKLLSLVCAIAVFVSALAGALVFPLANTANEPLEDTAFIPTVSTTEGKKIKLYPDTDLTGLGVVDANTVSVVKNTSSLPLTSLYSATMGAYTRFDGVKSADYKGAVMYVEIPDIGPVKYNDGTTDFETDQFRFGVTFLAHEEATPDTDFGIYDYTYGGGWYSMPVGDSQWTAEAKEFYGIELEYGFKGYVYIPFSTFAVADHKFTDTSVLKGVSIRALVNGDAVFNDAGKVNGGKVTAENPIVYSLPILIKDDETTELPATDALVVGGEKAYLDARLIPAADATLDLTTASVSYVGTADGSAAAKGLRYLKGAQSALTRNLGTVIKGHRTYNDEFGGVNAAGRGYFTDVAFSDLGAGIMVHVDIPKLDGNQTVTFSFADNVKGTTRWVDTNVGNSTWYLLPDGATAWQEKGASDWHNSNAVIVGDGTSAFSGYVFIPKNIINNYSSGIVTLSEIRVAVLPWRYSNKQPNTQEVNISVSAVSLISKFNKDSTLAYADTGALVDLATGDVVRTNYEAAKPFYGYPTVNDTNSYLTAKAAKLNGFAFYQMPAANVVHFQSSGAATYAYAPSVAPLSDSASLKIGGTTGASRSNYVAFEIANEVIGTTTGVLMYVETEGQYSFGFMQAFTKAAGGSAYEQFSYTGTFRYLANGATEWASTTAKTPVNGVSQLPENFKGYIYIPYCGTRDAADKIFRFNIFVAAANDNTPINVYAGNPMLVEAFTEENAGLIKYNGATETQNMFSGEYYVPVTAETDTGDADDNNDVTNQTLVTATADKVSEIVDGAGAYTSSFALVDSVTPLNTKKSVSVTPVARYIANGADAAANKVAIFNFSESHAMADVEGFMYYVDVSANTNADKPVNIMIKNHAALNGGSGANVGVFGWSCVAKTAGRTPTVYLLADDGETGTKWTAQALPTDRNDTTANVYGHIQANSGINLPAGFKGYLYIPADCYQLNTTSFQSIAVFMSASVSLSEAKYYLSAPMIVSNFDAESVYYQGDSGKVNLDTNQVIAGGETPGPGEGGGETPDPGPGTGGETPDPNPGGGGETPDPTPTRPTEEPDYDLPKYDGEKVDYLGNGYGISKVWIGRFNEKVFVGWPFAKDSDTCGVDGGNYEVVNSIVKFSKYPSMKITATSGSATVKHYLDATTTKGATSVAYYVEAPADKAIRVTFRVNAHKEAGGNAYGSNWSRPVFIMTEESKVWTPIATNSYYATLPAGFKGYIRQDYKDLGQINTVEDVSTVSAYYTSLIFADIAADDIFSISAPIFIDKIDTEKVPNAAYIGSDDGCARELFTGEFVKPGDADLGNKTIEPDYKVPAYTGAAIDYGKLDIMHVRTAKLNGAIIIGNDIHSDVMSPAFGKISATDSLVGISKYPMFKIEDAKIPAGETKTTVYTANYDYKANLGAKSVMFYVKIPKGQDSDFGLSWSWASDDGRSTGAYNYNGVSYIMAKGETEWTYAPISKYWTDLPAGFEGYIRYDLKDIYCVYPFDENGNIVYKLDENGNKIYKDPNNKNLGYVIDPDADHYSLKTGNWGVQAVYAALSNMTEGAECDAIVSSPILIDEFIPLQTIQNIAYVDGDTSAARNIFTGAVVKLGDFDATAGAEPDYDIPHHSGKAENYDNLLIMKTRTSKLNDAVIIGKKFSAQALTPGENTTAKPVKSIYPLTNYPSVAMTSNDGDSVTVTMKTSAEKNAGATGVMVYVKAPADTETAIRFSWNFTNVKDQRTTGAFNYSGNAYIMGKDDTEWTYVNIEKYYVSLPAGFEGYVRYELKKIHTVYSFDEDGKIRWVINENGERKIASDGDHYYLDKDWGLFNVYCTMSGVTKGKTAYVSTPIMVDEIDETSTTPRATFHNGEKFARDIFSGAVLKRIDLDKPIAVGDTIKKMPDPTTDLKAKVSDKQRLGEGKAVISWEAFEGADRYVVRVFKNLSGATGLVYNCVAIYEVDEGTSVEITGLAANTRYSVVVYALDADGNEIATYDYVTVSTVGAKAPDNDDKADNTDTDTDEESDGIPLWVWIVIGAAGGALLLAAVVVVVIVLVVKKRKAKAGQ